MAQKSLRYECGGSQLPGGEIGLGLTDDSKFHLLVHRQVLHLHLVEHLHRFGVDLGFVNDAGIGDGVITKEDAFEADAPAGYLWADRGGDALTLMDLQAAGHEFGLSGLRGTDPQLYVSMYGEQKYFQDEIVAQVMGAKSSGLNPRHFLLHIPPKAKPKTLSLPAFIAAKGFAHVVDVLPDYVPQMPLAASRVKDPVVHAYTVTTNNFNRALIATLAQRNEVLVVAPNRQVLPTLLAEVRAQGVPFATLADLK